MKAFYISWIAAAAFATYMTSSLDANQMGTLQNPTLGNPQAQVQVVAFLEPKCPDSKQYNNESFPKLQKDFIDTNTISYTVITTSFLPQSMPAAIALLCVYNQNDQKNANLFFKYLGYIYKNQPPKTENWATTETLQKFATKASSEIDQARLKACIESKHYQDQIEKNNDLAHQQMSKLIIPSIFVDGKRIENKESSVDYDSVKKAIQEALQNKKSNTP